MYLCQRNQKIVKTMIPKKDPIEELQTIGIWIVVVLGTLSLAVKIYFLIYPK